MNTKLLKSKERKTNTPATITLATFHWGKIQIQQSILTLNTSVLTALNNTPQFTYMVILGRADRSFDSVQMWLNGLHVRWMLTPTHLQDQLVLRKKTNQIHD